MISFWLMIRQPHTDAFDEEPLAYAIALFSHYAFITPFLEAFDIFDD